MYHRFGEAALPSTSIALSQLEGHIALLQDGGHTVVPLSDVIADFEGSANLPDKAVAITVDDAYQSFLTDGWPRLKAAGFPVTLFVATEGIDSGYADLLSWNDIRSLRDEGVAIAAHSHSHAHYPSLSEADLKDDLGLMAASFQRELGAVPKLFAFPYGEAGRADMSIVKAAGFRAAFGQHSGPAGTLSERFYLPRFPLNEAFGGSDRFRLIINTVPLPVIDFAPAEPILNNNPPSITLRLARDLKNIAALTCFGPGGMPMETAVDEEYVWVIPPTVFPTGRARLNCTLQASTTGIDNRWHWFGWQWVAGFASEGAPVHARYR